MYIQLNLGSEICNIKHAEILDQNIGHLLSMKLNFNLGIFIVES